MTKHDANRREFLVRTAVGAGAIAGAELVPDANAQDQQQRQKADTSAQARSHGEGEGAFFNRGQAAIVVAFTERLMPGAPGKPGAREAGVLQYIDLALAGAYADLQDYYRRGLAQLDTYCRTTYHQRFVLLTAARQDQVIAALEEGKATGFKWPDAQEFFNTVRTHTMEGMFADPIYGGNKDFSGWRLVGFPGTQPVFTEADMQSTEAFAGAPIMGLQTQAKGPIRRK